MDRNQTRICKECKHFVTEATAPLCGRVRAPIFGTPLRSCETERLCGFDLTLARESASKLDACGPDGDYWEAAPAPAQNKRFFRFGSPKLVLQS